MRQEGQRNHERTEGEAANKGKVTIKSLFDYIDNPMMLLGQMTGRVVLMHYA